jgi:hypothetical protein
MSNLTYSTDTPHFMEPEFSWPCSQDPNFQLVTRAQHYAILHPGTTKNVHDSEKHFMICEYIYRHTLLR